jgi:hypothetical protein
MLVFPFLRAAETSSGRGTRLVSIFDLAVKAISL